MVSVDEIQEPAEKLSALLISHSVDMLDVAANGEDALPSCDRVGADYRVDGLELGAHILGRAAWLVVQFESRLLGNLAEPRLFKGHSERLEELLVGLAEAVIELIPRSPQGV
jgi:hypothetical protein